jgi:hypothetical protein
MAMVYDSIRTSFRELETQWPEQHMRFDRDLMSFGMRYYRHCVSFLHVERQYH